MKKITFAAAGLALALGAPPSVPADTLTFSLAHFATDNLFQTSHPESDQVTQLGVAWNKPLGPFSIYVDGASAFVWKNSGLSDFRLDMGADVVLPTGEKSMFYLGLEAGVALYRGDFADFSYGAVRGRSAYKGYLSPSSIIKAEALTEYRKYNLSLFDFFSQTLTLSLDKFFPSKTTVKAELGWGYKYFLHPHIALSSTTAATAGLQAEVADTSSDALGDGSLRNPGNGGGNGPGSGGAGSSPGAGSGPSAGPGPGNPGAGKGYGTQRDIFTFGSAVEGETNGQGLQVATISGLVAQGLGDSIGLRLSASRQWCLSGQNPFASIEEYTLVENPTYDRFSWQGYILGAQAAAALPGDIALKLGYTVSEKEFPGVGALAADGSATGLTRRDTRRQLELRLDKTFSRVSLFLAAGLLRNTSNDPLFSWKGTQIFGGLTWNPGGGGN